MTIGVKRARVEAFIYGPPSGGREFVTLPAGFFEHLMPYLRLEDQKSLRLSSTDCFRKTRDVFTRSVKWLCSHVSQVCLTAEWKRQMRFIRLNYCQDVSCIPFYIRELELIDRDGEAPKAIRRLIKFPSHLVNLQKLVVKDQSSDTDDCLDVDLSALPGLKYAEISIAGDLVLPKSATLETLKLRHLDGKVDLRGQTVLKRLDTEIQFFKGEIDLQGLDALEEVKLKGEGETAILRPKHWGEVKQLDDHDKGFTVLRPLKPLLG